MSDLPTPSASSRFVSQAELDQAKQNREEQWKAAYARLGQEPPPQREEVVSDGRSLFERLQSNKIAKEEQWQEQHKLSKQFRALEEDEILFLQSVRAKKHAEEEERRREEKNELEGFRTAVAARHAAPEPPLPGSSTSPSTSKPPPLAGASKKPEQPKPKPKPGGGKKDQKALLKGVVVKKKEKEKEKAAPVSKAPPAPAPGRRKEGEERAKALPDESRGGEEKTGDGGAEVGKDGKESGKRAAEQEEEEEDDRPEGKRQRVT